jgi:hypothetical protein
MTDAGINSILALTVTAMAVSTNSFPQATQRPTNADRQMRYLYDQGSVLDSSGDYSSFSTYQLVYSSPYLYYAYLPFCYDSHQVLLMRQGHAPIMPPIAEQTFRAGWQWQGRFGSEIAGTIAIRTASLSTG